MAASRPHVALERPLPYNLDAERSVLGAVMLDNHQLPVAEQMLRPEDFFLPEHRKIFERMLTLDESRKAIDSVTLMDELDRRGELSAAGGPAYLAALLDGVPRVSDVEHYARIVREKATLRKLAHTAAAIQERTLEPDADSTQILADAERQLGHVGAEPGRNAEPPCAWPTLAPDALHGPAGDFVRAVEPAGEADPAALLVQFLVAAGYLFGHEPHVPVEGDRQTANINAVVVAQTGSGRKGTAWGRCREVLEHADPEWAAYCVKGGLSSGEGLIFAVRDARQKLQPVMDGKRIVGHEAVEDDPGVSDKRLLVMEAEFSSVLKMAAREGNILSNVVRQAFDSGTLRILTKNNPCQASSAHISILGHVTPDELLRYLSETESGNGFANRFLWVCAKRSKCLPEGGAVPREALRVIAERQRRATEFAKTLGAVARDESAREMWKRVYQDLSAGRPGLVGSILGRAEAQVTRLSLIYALLDCSAVIRPEHLLAALAVWEYAAASVRFIFGDRLGDPVADGILEALRTSGPKTRTEISAMFSRNCSSARIAAALKALEREGLAQMDRGQGNNGRPAEVWKLTKPGER